MRPGTVILTALALAAPATAQRAHYRLTVDNTWSAVTHPGAFPPFAHFSWLGGGTHDAAVSLWNVGQVASPAMVQMAETGETTLLEFEVALAMAAGSAGGVLAWHEHFNSGVEVREFDIEVAHPRVTLLSMLGPSPDWFVGVSGLALHDGTDWLDRVVVDIRPYDGGSRDTNVFSLFGPLTTPPQPVSLITAASGQLIGPASLGSFVFERIEPALFADVRSVSAAAGDTQTLDIWAGAAHAGRLYLLAGSASGTSPGFDLFGVGVPLNLDDYLNHTFWNVNQYPMTGSLGVLDSSGRGTVQFRPFLNPELVGITLHHAAVVFELDPLLIAGATNAVRVELN